MLRWLLWAKSAFSVPPTMGKEISFSFSGG
jgi:hypothetical protein